MAATISRGVRAPIIREGDDIVKITVDSVMAACKEDGFELDNKDVVCVTESIVARAAKNYCSTDDIAEDVKAKLGGETVGVVFPIYSRNRFAICLRGIARGAKKVIIQMGYPSDEVGNHLISEDQLDDSNVNPYSDVLTDEEFRQVFGDVTHQFTGVDYIEYYKKLIEEEGAEAQVIMANRPEAILGYTKNVIVCDTHSRERNARRIKKAGGEKVFTMADIMNAPINGSGFNSKYGLLGSNKATENTIKLFPENAQEVAEAISEELSKQTGKQIEALVYGDGAFKDPVGKI